MSEKENPCSMPIDLMCVKDYQLAQMIERQEKEQLKYQKSLGIKHIHIDMVDLFVFFHF